MPIIIISKTTKNMIFSSTFFPYKKISFNEFEKVKFENTVNKCVIIIKNRKTDSKKFRGTLSKLTYLHIL